MDTVLDFLETLEEMIYIVRVDDGEIVYLNRCLREALTGASQSESPEEEAKGQLARILARCRTGEGREENRTQGWMWEDPDSKRSFFVRSSVHCAEGQDYCLTAVVEVTGNPASSGEESTALSCYLERYEHDLPFFLSAYSHQNHSSYFYFGDVQREIYYISDNLREKFGFAQNIVRGLPEEWAKRISTERDRARFRADIQRVRQKRGAFHDLRYQVKDRSGQNVWLRSYGELQWNEDGTKPLFLAGRLTQQDENFVVDPVTNFPQESVLIRHLEIMRQRGQSCLVIGFSLNNIAQINSIQGRTYGDFLIRSIANQLVDKLSNRMAFYRMVGMRCLALVEQEAAGDRESVIAQIREIVEENYRRAGISVHQPCSFAVMSYPQPEITALDFIENMEALIRTARDQQSRSFVDNTQGSVRRFQEEASMALFISRDVLNDMEDFRAVVQPVVSGETGEIIGGETLMRWKFMGEDVSPSVFIPILEKEGMIHLAGRWIFAEAVKICASMLPYNPEFLLSVNVSLLQLADLEFGSFMRDILDHYGLDGSHIIVEITESCLDQQPERLQRFVDACNSCGIRIALDDFGSGYSSFRVLLRYPSSVIKLDRSLLLEMTESTDKMNFISSIVYACHRFGKMVCIEGVETTAQDNLAKECQCDVIQGFHYYGPMETEQLAALMEKTAEARRADDAEAAARKLREEQEAQEMKELLCTFFQHYFLERDPEQIMTMFVEQALDESPWAGDAQLEKEAVQTLLRAERAVLPQPRAYRLLELHQEPAGDEGRWTCSCTVELQTEENEQSESDILGLTAVVQKQEDGWRFQSIQWSDVSDQRRDGELLSLQIIAEKLDGKDSEHRQRLFQTIMQLLPDGVVGWYLEEGLPIYAANDCFARMSGYQDYQELESAIHGEAIRLVHPEDRVMVTRVLRETAENSARYEMIYRLHRKDGSYLWVREVGRRTEGSGEHNGFISVLTDISSQMKVKTDLREEAEMDTLTGIYNRRDGTKRIERALPTCHGYLFAIMDMDNLKRVNDLCGYGQGDEALCFVAETLRDSFRETDTVFRLGGDEFAVFVENCETRIDAIAERFQEIARVYAERMRKVCPQAKSSLSVGGVYSCGKHSFSQLYQKADKTLYEVKKSEKGRVALRKL